MSEQYTVERCKYGVVIRGPLPIDDMLALSKMYKKQNYDTAALRVAAALKATMAVCAKEDVEKWEAEIDAQAKKLAGGDMECEWLNGTDTGTSSRTIFSVLSARWGSIALQGHSRPSTPSDPSDFGRCHRLLERFPKWRARLHEVAERYPAWVPLVREWDALTALWLEESPTGKCPKLYSRMKELLT